MVGIERSRCCVFAVARLRASRHAPAARQTATTQTGTMIATDASSAFFFFFLKRDLSQAEHLQAFFALVPSADLALHFFFA